MILVQFPSKEENIEEETIYTPEEQEILIESGETIYRSQSSSNLSIIIEPSETILKGFIEDPYFKVFKGSNIQKTNEIARISIKAPHYIYHNKSGEKALILNSSQRKELNGLMSIKSNSGKFKNQNYTVYEALLYMIYLVSSNLPKVTYEDIKKKFPQPDFTNIKE